MLGARLLHWLLDPATPESPGARALLADAERTGEETLHVIRGLFWVVLSVGWIVVLHATPLTFSAVLLVALAAWVVIRLALSATVLPWWLPYALVLFDGYGAGRIALAVAGPIAPLYGGLIARVTGVHIGVEDVKAVVPPILTYLALSGALRINVRVALFAALVAVGTYVLVAIALETPFRLATLVGLTIAFSGALGVAGARIHRALVLRAREEALLERYVPESLRRDLHEATANGREEEVTILLADVRGFTHRTERLAPAQAMTFVNETLAVVVAPLRQHGAVIDKFLGDGVLAFFEDAAHATRALRAARGMLRAIEARNARGNGEPLRIGIAVHTGRAMLGTIGTAERREYTVISDAVNVTARLEELNKRFGSCLVVSEATLRATPAAEHAGLVGPEPTTLRGREDAMGVAYLPAGNSNAES
jgi:class 3 adenylate cyclase